MHLSILPLNVQYLKIWLGLVNFNQTAKEHSIPLLPCWLSNAGTQAWIQIQLSTAISWKLRRTGGEVVGEFGVTRPSPLRAGACHPKILGRSFESIHFMLVLSSKWWKRRLTNKRTNSSPTQWVRCRWWSSASWCLQQTAPATATGFPPCVFYRCLLQVAFN